MEDAIDDAMGDEDDEEEGDKVVQQVLDELGLDLGDKLNGQSGVRVRRARPGECRPLVEMSEASGVLEKTVTLGQSRLRERFTK